MKYRLRIQTFLAVGMLLVILTAFLFPLVWLVLSSFKTPTDIFAVKFQISFTPTLDNYIYVINSVFSKKLLTSAFVSFAATILTIASGLLAAYALSRLRFKGRDTMFFLLLTTAFAPPVAIAVPVFMMFRSLGLLDIHIGLILLYAASNMGFCVWVLRGFLEDVPRAIEEAAMIDGCSLWRVLIHITIPVIRGGIVTTAILVFIFNWNEFFFASVLTRTRAATFTTHLVTYFGSRRVLWGELCAASVIGILPPVVLAMLARRFLVRGMTLGAVRG